MRINNYIAPEVELIRMAPDRNFVQTTGGGTGEGVDIGGPEEDW